jgi:ferric-dicitrate binding protein FerR (iron transport regulator)
VTPPRAAGDLPAEDLVARALGALPPAEAAALDARLARDAAARARYAEVEDHLARYDALAAVPRPAAPPAERALAGLDARRAGAPAWAALAAAAVLAAVVLLLPRPSRSPEADPVTVAVEGARLLRDGREVAASDARAGDVVVAPPGVGEAVARIGARTTVALDPGSEVRILSGDESELRAGAARFAVAPDPKAPRVVARADGVRVEVTGTRFALERAGGEVALDVVEGSVLVAGVAVSSGERWTFAGGRARTERPVPRSPRVSLSTASPEGARPVRLRLRVENPTAAELPLPSPDDPRGPYYLEVTDPAGAVVAVRVGSGNLEGDALPSRLRPRGVAEATLRTEATFARPGTYRLRTFFLGRPAGPAAPGGDLEIVLR